MEFSLPRDARVQFLAPASWPTKRASCDWGDGADGALDGVVVDLDSAFGEEAPEAVTVFGDVGKGLAQG